MNNSNDSPDGQLPEDACYTLRMSAMTSSIGSHILKAISVGKLLKVLDSIPPPMPDRQFVFEGEVHAVFTRGTLFFSQRFFDCMMNLAVPAHDSTVGEFMGLPVRIDSKLPWKFVDAAAKT